MAGTHQIIPFKNRDPHIEEAANYISCLLKQPFGNPLVAPSSPCQERIEQLETQVKLLSQQLQASRSAFRNIIDKNADAIVIIDGEGKIRFANPCAEALFNLSINELLGQDFFGRFVVERQASEINTGTIPSRSSTATVDTLVVQTQVDIICHSGFTGDNNSDIIAEMRVVETEWEGQRAFLVTLRDITERNRAEVALRTSEARLRQQTQELERTLTQLRQTQAHLVQSEKMSSLGQMVAGVAHEINNPVNFISGNLAHTELYTSDLISLLQLYQKHYPQPHQEILNLRQSLDIDFIVEDFPKLLDSMKVGAERIRQIVLSLRNFSRVDQAEKKPVDIHEGIESTLMILQNRFKQKAGQPEIKIIKQYSALPKVECYASSLNQVFMNILANAADALEEISHPRTITISTQLKQNQPGAEQIPSIVIRIKDNGPGIDPQHQNKLFDPFFTTKPVGSGTGLGLSIAYQIVVEKHGGILKCISAVGEGAEFLIEIPLRSNL